ncbi:MAG: hypothetical protein EOP72_02015 [Variovorax sp.]|jgi:hypothetical protein|nr:MAG: hypothetical protein EOP72_02015 [Variovorax sp.]
MLHQTHALTAAAIACTLLLAATPATAVEMFRFDRGIGSEPLRAGPAGVPPVPNPSPVANVVAGVAPGGAPWPVESLKVDIGYDGRIRAVVQGLVLGGTDNIGTRGGPRRIVISLFCRDAPAPGAVAGALQTIPYNSEFVELDPDGNFRLDSALTNASGATPQANCGDSIDNRPVLLVRTVTAANAGTGAPAAPGAWFAAGVLKNAQHRDDDNGRDNRGR